jgi:transmembrane sensor
MAKAADIEAQAATWLVRVDAGELPEEQQAAFEAWQEADPRHRAAYLRLAAAWRRADRLKELRPFESVPSQRVPRKFAVTVAVAASVLLGLALLHSFTRDSETWHTYSTGLGGFQRVVLWDGSAVELNTGSEVRVNFSAKDRRVVLIRGEANFKVTHNPTRPFDVTAGGTAVRAVGTEFSVSLRDNQTVDVLVTEGRVAIRPLAGSSAGHAAQGPMLGPGEIATVSASGASVQLLPPDSVARRLAWTTGRLMFNGQTLAEAAAEFNLYNRCKLVIADPDVASLQVGGSFVATDLDSFVAALGHALNVRVREDGESTSSGDCGAGGEIVLVGSG